MWAIYTRAFQTGEASDMKEIKFEDTLFFGVPGYSPAVISPDYSIDELQDEKFLTETITELWTTRQLYSTEIKGERQCIRGIDSKLGQMMFQMKLILAKPGRGGGWSSWLVERGISRATADRLVNRFAKSRGLYDQLSHEAVSAEPTEIQINTLFASVWPRIERRLPTPRARYDFLRCYLYRSGLAHEWQNNGILVYEPGHEAAPAPSVQDGDIPFQGLAGDDRDVL
jgi:hypothetical protein